LLRHYSQDEVEDFKNLELLLSKEKFILGNFKKSLIEVNLEKVNSQ